MRRWLNALREGYRLLYRLHDRVERLQLAVGRIELRQQQALASSHLPDNEFQVHSQGGEDGIIQFLLRHVPIQDPRFVEFGVEDYYEANTRFLLQHNRWAGLVLDGSAEQVARLKREPLYWRYNLKAVQAFVNAENINALLRENGMEGPIGLLSVDIDGNDYWVWKAIEVVQPAIVICEYNSLFGPTRQVTIPYDPAFVRQQAHHSTLYYGASIAALHALGQEKGYALVGANRTGNNLFFVRQDLQGELPRRTPEEAYVRASFRESRDESGQLTFLDWAAQRALVAALPLYDIEQERLVRVSDL